MKALLIIICCIALSSNLSFAQGTYYNKKVELNFDVLGRMPLFYRFTDFQDNDNTKLEGNRLVSYRDFDYGFMEQVVFLSKNSASFGVNVMQYKTNVIRNYLAQMSSDGYYETSNYSTIEDLQVNTLIIMPIISYSMQDLIKPVGLTNEFGFGYIHTTVKDKDYHFINNSGSVEKIAPPYNTGTDGIYKGFSMMYTIKFSKPISRSLMFNMGMRYSLQFGNKNNKNVTAFNDYILDDYIRKAVNRNYINFFAGISVLL